MEKYKTKNLNTISYIKPNNVFKIYDIEDSKESKYLLNKSHNCFLSIDNYKFNINDNNSYNFTFKNRMFHDFNIIHSDKISICSLLDLKSKANIVNNTTPNYSISEINNLSINNDSILDFKIKSQNSPNKKYSIEKSNTDNIHNLLNFEIYDNKNITDKNDINLFINTNYTLDISDKNNLISFRNSEHYNNIEEAYSKLNYYTYFNNIPNSTDVKTKCSSNTYTDKSSDRKNISNFNSDFLLTSNLSFKNLDNLRLKNKTSNFKNKELNKKYTEYCEYKEKYKENTNLGLVYLNTKKESKNVLEKLNKLKYKKLKCYYSSNNSLVNSQLNSNISTPRNLNSNENNNYNNNNNNNNFDNTTISNKASVKSKSKHATNDKQLSTIKTGYSFFNKFEKLNKRNSIKIIENNNNNLLNIIKESNNLFKELIVKKNRNKSQENLKEKKNEILLSNIRKKDGYIQSLKQIESNKSRKFEFIKNENKLINKIVNTSKLTNKNCNTFKKKIIKDEIQTNITSRKNVIEKNKELLEIKYLEKIKKEEENKDKIIKEYNKVLNASYNTNYYNNSSSSFYESANSDLNNTGNKCFKNIKKCSIVNSNSKEHYLKSKLNSNINSKNKLFNNITSCFKLDFSKINTNINNNNNNNTINTNNSMLENKNNLFVKGLFNQRINLNKESNNIKDEKVINLKSFKIKSNLNNKNISKTKPINNNTVNNTLNYININKSSNNKNNKLKQELSKTVNNKDKTLQLNKKYFK